jgi:hypothetical protein
MLFQRRRMELTACASHRLDRKRPAASVRRPARSGSEARSRLASKPTTSRSSGRRATAMREKAEFTRCVSGLSCQPDVPQEIHRLAAARDRHHRTILFRTDVGMGCGGRDAVVCACDRRATPVVKGRQRRATRAAVPRLAKPCGSSRPDAGAKFVSFYRLRDDGILQVICPTRLSKYSEPSPAHKTRFY